MPFSASPKPAPSSASPSGIISVPGWAAPIPAPSPISRNSSARRSRAPNRPDFCPYYVNWLSVFLIILNQGAEGEVNRGVTDVRRDFEPFLDGDVWAAPSRYVI